MAAVLMAGSTGITSYAANVKITSLSLDVENEIEVGNEIETDDITITAKGGKFTVTDINITTEGFEWEPSHEPTCEVRLEAADGYYFSITTKNIKIKGATYVKGKKEDSKTLLLTLKLPSLTEVPGKVEEAGWGSGTLAQWSEAYNVGNYEVRLYRDDVNVKGTQTTAGTSMDLGSGMTKAGTYSYRVRGVNKVNPEKKSSWTDSSTLYIDDVTAAKMREIYGSSTSGLSEPGVTSDGQAVQTGWIQDQIGWWYRNADGSYTVNNWQLINTQWYYFDSRGYMVTGWIQTNDKWYFCDLTNGHMLTSCLTPDGFRVDSQGVYIQ